MLDRFSQLFEKFTIDTFANNDMNDINNNLLDRSIKIYLIIFLISIAILFFIIIMAFSPYSYYNSHYSSHYKYH